MEMLLQEKENELINKTKTNDDVLVIILQIKNFDFGATRMPYELNICGKKMWEWVSLCAGDSQVKTVVGTPESDVLQLVKPHLTDKKYTVVLYSDTPLFSAKTFNDVLTYFRGRGANVLKLKRGYVFDTEYVKNAESLMAFESQNFGTEQDFLQVDSMQKLYEVTKIIEKRILQFHTSQGVIIKSYETTHIDCDVIIGEGTIIEPNNNLYGLTFVGKNCILEPNNVITDSIISENCIVKNSYIQNSRISESMVVGPFESVINQSN